MGDAVNVLLPKTHAAHRAAGVPEDLARDAAAEVGSLAVSLTVVKRMVGFMLGLQVATIALLFRIALRMG